VFGTKNTGINFDKYLEIPVSVRDNGISLPSSLETFDSMLDVMPTVVMDNIIRAGFTRPTPVQQHSFPYMTARYDLMATAQTGSGKTAAFLCPIMSNLLLDCKNDPTLIQKPLNNRDRKAMQQVSCLSVSSSDRVCFVLCAHAIGMTKYLHATQQNTTRLNKT
jgi:hypothetical protein